MSPRDPGERIRVYREDVFFNADTKLKEIFDGLQRVTFCGHTHVPCVIGSDMTTFTPKDGDAAFTFAPGMKYIVNVGSVGQPRDRDPRSAWTEVDGDTVKFHRVPYDIAAVRGRSARSPNFSRCSPVASRTACEVSMNSKYFGVLLFVGVFAATFLLLRDGFSAPGVPDREPDRPSPVAGNAGEVERIRTSAQARAASVEEKRSRVDTTAISDATTGVVAVAVTTDDGIVPADVRVASFPRGGRARRGGDGRVEWRNVPPGIYSVQVSADKYLPQPVPAAAVAKGTRTDVQVVLQRAMFFSGVVTEETQGRPIEGASIDFNGMMRATSGPDGRFKTAARVLPGALDVIRVHHPDYDSQHFLRMPITDIANIRLAMGRGKGTIEGRLVPIGRREAPGAVRRAGAAAARRQGRRSPAGSHGDRKGRVPYRRRLRRLLRARSRVSGVVARRLPRRVRSHARTRAPQVLRMAYSRNRERHGDGGVAGGNQRRNHDRAGRCQQ
jgi:hypothetical protein